MALVYQEFLNANARKCYPFKQGGPGLPNDLLVDAHVALPDILGEGVFVSSIAVTAGLVSITLQALNPQFTPVALLTLSRPLVPYRNYAIEAYLPGVAGWLAFGPGVLRAQALSLRLAPSEGALLERCVRRYQGNPVTALKKDGQALALSGLVRLKGDGINTVTRKAVRTINGLDREVAVIAMRFDDDRVAKSVEFAGPCGHRPEGGTCNAPPIERINTVRPDSDGNIQLEFRGGVLVGDVGIGMVVDSPLSLSEVCPPLAGPSLIPGSGTYTPEVVPPPDPETPEPEEEPSSSLALPPEYCEDFSGVPEELEVRKGIFELQDLGTEEAPMPAFVCLPGLGEKLALDVLRDMDAHASYFIEVRAKPLVAEGNAYLAFAYQDIDNHYVAGISLRASPDYPQGRYFIARVTANPAGSDWPNGLGDGYKFLVSGPLAAPTELAEYRLGVRVQKIETNIVIELTVEWSGGALEQVLALPVGVFPRFGRVGFGSMDSEVAFRRFGIDCQGFE